MPKIIENLKEKLIAEATAQLRSAGYEATTVRSVAKACGVGVGTVYNYFPSKDQLIAACMLQSWQSCIASINKTAEKADTPAPVARCIFDQLQSYTHDHQFLFRDKKAVAVFAGSFGKYHALLRSQLAEPFRKFSQNKFTCEFAAEALLTWTMNGKSFEEIYNILKKIF